MKYIDFRNMSSPFYTTLCMLFTCPFKQIQNCVALLQERIRSVTIQALKEDRSGVI